MAIYYWIKSVITGWWLFIFKKDHIENMAKSRSAYCAVCPHAKNGLFDAIEDSRIPEISGKSCYLCGCALVAKLRSPDEECPIGLWGSQEFKQ